MSQPKQPGAKRRKLFHRSVQPQALDRRTFLRGMIAGASVSMALPALEVMLDTHGTAHADGSEFPCRFGVFYWGCGYWHDEWIPDRTGPSWELPPALQGFADLREYLTHVTGTSHRESYPPHIPFRGLSLSSSHNETYVEGSVPGYRRQEMPEPSVDQLVAEAFGDDANWLGIGICRRGPYRSMTSWGRGGQAHEHYSSPQSVFDRLFSNVHGGGEPSPLVAATTAIRKSMLDAVMGDAAKLRDRLPAGDKQRLESHLEALRAIERDIQTQQPGTCEVPGAPGGGDYGDGSAREEKRAKHDVMRELLAVGLACNLTRVFSYEWSANQSEAVYWELGLSGQHHDLSHESGGSIRQITRFIMDRYAELGQSLRNQPEGAGNVLDNTLILGTSEHANPMDHNSGDHPHVFLGKACGRIRAGIHYRDPNPGAARGNSNNNFNAPRVLLTAAHMVGANIPRLGANVVGIDRVATEPIAELMT